MKSYFDADDKPKVDVKVVGLDGQIEVPALIDTGFDGTLMLSLPKALSIGLKLSTVIPIELADGSIKNEYVFEGKVILGQEIVPVEIFLTTSDESLVGTALLCHHKLTIDFLRRAVVITPSK
jgi:predicted aspartyl protease